MPGMLGKSPTDSFPRPSTQPLSPETKVFALDLGENARSRILKTPKPHIDKIYSHNKRTQREREREREGYME